MDRGREHRVDLTAYNRRDQGQPIALRTLTPAEIEKDQEFWSYFESWLYESNYQPRAENLVNECIEKIEKLNFGHLYALKEKSAQYQALSSVQCPIEHRFNIYQINK